ncbi:hypothetical protein KY284_019567 [Solanum tuberosum]|nr:hypothetical protein KY284_019567 [Solanum tuberosum]
MKNLHNATVKYEDQERDYASSSNLVISFSEMFNYILPYCYLDKAKQLVNGARKGVAMFNEDAGRRYSLTKLTTRLQY